MAEPTRTEIERRALALVERLSARRDNQPLRDRMLRNEHPEVIARVNKILANLLPTNAIPTELPGAVGGPTLAPPGHFGAFRFVGRIGSGGMGEVWRGERDDGLFDQTVAIKLIQPHLQTRAGEAFESERRILARLEHPNIARLIDGGTTADGRACLVMEFIDGTPFDEACGPAPLVQRVALLKQVLSAVQYAHGRLVAHGDLKPNNIMVDRDGRVRLLDFGIARLLGEEANDLRLTGAVTSSFASPARLRGEPPSIPDDVFALGRLMALVLGNDADTELTAIAAKACSQNEASRYPTTAEFIADLDRWTRCAPVSAIPRTGLYVTRKYVRRNWQGLGAAAALLGALSYAGVSYGQAQRERAEASARFDDARGTARYLLFTLYDELAAHPNTLGLRREVAMTAQHYLDRLAQSRSTVPEVRLEAAQGLQRLAQVQSSPRFPNLGEPVAARRNLDLAVSLLDRNPFPLAREALAGTLLDSAFLAEMVEEQEDRALRDMAKARPLIEARATSRELTARYWIILATIDLWRQHYPDALAEAQRAAAILPQADTLDALSLRSQALTVQADMLFNSANPAASLPVYRAALVPLERAVQLYPRNALAHRRLANLLQNFGQSLPGAKEPREAPAILRRAIAEDETLVAFDSDDTDAPRNLNIARESLAAALIGIHDYAGGFAQFQQTEDTMRAAWLTRPGEERLLRDYAVVVGNYADELGANGRFAVACTKWPLSLDLYGQIDRKGHLSAQDRTIFVARMTESQRLHCK